MGFGDMFLKWIAVLLYTANTKVLVNDMPGERIQHVRGLRQGDPTSPLLYVLGMEVFTALLVRAHEQNLLGYLAGISPLQRISIYADDIILFLAPQNHELRAVKEILQVFGGASGLHVNYSKSSATLIRGSEMEEMQVREELGCTIAKFPIKYLGLQLALRPLTKAE
jgi:hypothetical protein